MRDRYFPLVAVLVILAFSGLDYFLFRGHELVWPFFFLPYLFFLILYLIFFFRRRDKDILELLINVFVVFPVVSGLIMSIGWMAKINFWGEFLGRLMNR